jgi:GNAT superfamily N-acetyltransferase
VLAATMGDEIVGGLMAHMLPMTRSESREIFIYDIAVHASHQRRGVGRLLMSHLARLAGEVGIADMFVPADDEDSHAPISIALSAASRRRSRSSRSAERPLARIGDSQNRPPIPTLLPSLGDDNTSERSRISWN